ncbi:hypothetical protein ACFTWF_32575 [Rhodococcus sp. NPDC056960]|uniref:hypothetical protein n=1 Tax=Rhodococcus sp. NPDC056960 TaxID=3345982 RepID=UPI00363422AE
MAERTIWHAIFEWFEDGVRHYAYRGEVVDIPQDVIEQYEKFGVFDAPAPEPASGAQSAPEPAPEGVEEPAAGESDDGDASADAGAPVRPKRAALSKDWENYVVALHEFTGGTDGLTRDEAEAATRESLIARFGK